MNEHLPLNTWIDEEGGAALRLQPGSGLHGKYAMVLVSPDRWVDAQNTPAVLAAREAIARTVLDSGDVELIVPLPADEQENDMATWALRSFMAGRSLTQGHLPSEGRLNRTWHWPEEGTPTQDGVSYTVVVADRDTIFVDRVNHREYQLDIADVVAAGAALIVAHTTAVAAAR